jgi:hypothetical protein
MLFLKSSNKMTLLYSILFPASYCTCFGRNIHPSSGTRLACIYSIWCWQKVCDLPSSSTTTAGHTLSTPDAVNSLIEFLMMGECFARNMYSSLQDIKYCTRVSSCWNFLELIRDARNDEHKIKYYTSIGNPHHTEWERFMLNDFFPPQIFAPKLPYLFT